MVEPTAAAAYTQFEDFLAEIIGARVNGRLNDATALGICAGLNDPLPEDLPVTNEAGDLIKVGLIICLALAKAHGRLTEQRMSEIVALTEQRSELPPASSPPPNLVSTLPAPPDPESAAAPDAPYTPPVLMMPPPSVPPERRDSMSPVITYENLSALDDGEDNDADAEDESLASVDDVVSVDDDMAAPVEQEADTIPPPPAADEDR